MKLGFSSMNIDYKLIKVNMSPLILKNNRIIIFSFIFSCLTLEACQNGSGNQRLPVLGNKTLETKTVNGKEITDTVYHQIGSFSFTDQDGKEVTEKSFAEKIYVADFIFTTCPSICPAMSVQMARVYEKYKGNDMVMFLSHSIDPEHDTPEVLKEYAARYGVKGNQWRFVTGDKKEIFDMGLKHYMVSAKEDPTAAGGLLHSGAFILVDKNKHIRGVYDGTNEEKVNQLIKDIDILIGEQQAYE